MNRILVTGAAGFIGSALVRELLQSDTTVVIAVALALMALFLL